LSLATTIFKRNLGFAHYQLKFSTKASQGHSNKRKKYKIIQVKINYFSYT